MFNYNNSKVWQAYRASLGQIGTPRYLNEDGSQCCMLAHLYLLMGGTVDEVMGWVDENKEDLTIIQIKERGLCPAFDEVPAEKLDYVQDGFDRSISDNDFCDVGATNLAVIVRTVFGKWEGAFCWGGVPYYIAEQINPGETIDGITFIGFTL